MSKMSRLGQHLYDGTVSIDFVGRRLLWYAISAVIVAIAMFGLLGKGLNLGIEFEGGVEYRVSMPAGQADQETVEEIREAVAQTAEDEGIEAASSPIVNTSGDNNIRVQTEPLTNDEATTISEAIQEAAGVGEDDISQAAIGATWGQQVADRALLGLGVFLVLVVLFIWAYFREWKMSVGALVALAHDVIITVGIYALSGFEVTPATVTGILTILGFSLYDTVVVFDKVRENTRNLARTHQTYGQAANLAVNQTLVRSINTSIVALLPVGALLYVGVVTLGSGALKDLALALFVGMAAGLYSSVFIATPLVVQLKEMEPGVKAGDARALRHSKRQEADRFANVPAFTEDMPVYDESAEPRDVPETDEEPERGPVGVTTPDRSRYTAGERPAGRPVAPSAAAKRAQPERKPRSQRGKK
ncbi:MAG TPA: protein translocase subunit SecF [Nocardioides sp.]|uniref:protein translocase subunit SecF n=1 Tax=Nocardioides sp. TaxID=35761 RepID=UPI002D80E861|nr:protein translocase subunit SecF [Nocardioides sp.]HET6653460.1 protein translocase subunit SecF [Nocardioides sp.]